jgi:hypothetical protein
MLCVIASIPSRFGNGYAALDKGYFPGDKMKTWFRGGAEVDKVRRWVSSLSSFPGLSFVFTIAKCMMFEPRPVVKVGYFFKLKNVCSIVRAT